MKKKIITLMCVLSVLLSNSICSYAEGEENTSENTALEGEVIREMTDEEIEELQKEIMEGYQNEENDDKTIIDVLEGDEQEEIVLTPQEQEAVGLMRALGVIEKDTDLNKKLTRAEFARVVYLISGHTYISESAIGTFKDVDKNTKYYGEISVLKDAGIISGYGDGDFRPDDDVKLEEVSKMLAHVMGVEWQIKNYSSYYALMNNFKLFTGIPDMTHESITYKQTACVLLKLLETDLENISTYDIDGVYMNEVLHIGKLEGVFKNDGRLDEVPKITIDSQVLESDGKDYSQYLFHKVTAYYKTDEDFVNTILSMTSHKNMSMLRLNHDEITDYNNRKYEYIKSDEKSARTVNLETTFDFVYNGVPVKNGNTLNLMVPKSGYVELIDYDNNRKYETVVVWDYDTFVVDSYNNNTMILTSLNGKSEINLTDIPYDIYMSGSENPLSTENIKYHGYVLSVARSINDEYVRIYLCEEIEGTVKSVDTDSVLINDKKYKIAEGLNISAGSGGTFYVNQYGAVIYQKNGNSNVEKYAYVIKTYPDEFNENLYIELFSQDSESIEAKILNTAVIDGKKQNGMNGVKVAINGVEGTIIKYKLNSDNDVTFIDTINYNAAESNSINKIYEVPSGVGFNSLNMALADNGYGVGKCPVTLDTIVFCVSEPYKDGQIWIYDMTQYTKKYATGYQVNLGELIVYNSNRDSVVGDVILNKGQSGGVGYTYSSGNIRSGAIVTDVAETINDDNEPCYSLTVKRGALSENIKVSAEAMKFDNGQYTISKGDIIKWGTDEEGSVPQGKMIVIYDCDRQWFDYSGGSSSFARAMTNEAGRWHRMWVYKRDGDHLISYNQDLAPREAFDETAIADYEEYKYIDYTRDVSTYKTLVYIYDTAEGLLYEGSVADIKTYENEGADCGEMFGFTSTGHRLFILYR